MAKEEETGPFLSSTDIDSPWDGDLRQQLDTWGYVEKPAKAFVRNFQDRHTAFEQLGIDTRFSVDGGPNMCYRVEHQDGPRGIPRKSVRIPLVETGQYIMVGADKFRMTGGYFEIGMNPGSGIVYFSRSHVAPGSCEGNLGRSTDPRAITSPAKEL
jgi:hypothetical protein